MGEDFWSLRPGGEPPRAGELPAPPPRAGTVVTATSHRRSCSIPRHLNLPESSHRLSHGVNCMNLIRLMLALALADRQCRTVSGRQRYGRGTNHGTGDRQRILADQGVLDGFGHVWCAGRQSPHYFIAVSRAPAIVKRSDIIEIDARDGKLVKPGARCTVSASSTAKNLQVATRRAVGGARPHHCHPAVRPDQDTLQAADPRGLFPGLRPRPGVRDPRRAGEDNKILISTAALVGARRLAKSLGQRTSDVRGHGMAVVAESDKGCGVPGHLHQGQRRGGEASLLMGKPGVLQQVRGGS